MMNFSSLFKSKLFKFLIFLVLLILFAIGFYKENKKEVKEVVFMYSESVKEKENTLKDDEHIIKEKQPIISTFTRMQKEKKWISKRAEEQRKMMEFIKKQKREEIMKKYKVHTISPNVSKKDSITTEDLKKKFEAIVEYNNLLKNEYKTKKRNGKINYKQKVKSQDYIYVSVILTSKVKHINDKFKDSTVDFVIHVDATKSKKFNQKLIGKKINDVVELELEDFLSEERIKMLNENTSNNKELVKIITERYPYLKDTPFGKSIDYMKFNMKTTILDILNKDFITKNKIKEKVFDYNAWE